ncbi:SMP-30/gluconolactonase/LRE family protein [Rhodococcoides navarretei]|uniref:SMP-30/Gluconolactonase/LRE-like region domain-containing protein n=1 Tax=Rhodococcus navarretei TaxID=3128981 RepID=A0ABU9CQ10_9NOCA
MNGRRIGVLVLTVMASCISGAVVTAPGVAAEPLAGSLDYGQTRDIAVVPLPGQPEGMAVDPEDGSIWSGSNRPNSSADVWHWDADGRLLATYSLTDRVPAEHGVNGIVLDGDGRVYALDYSGARAVRIDPATGNQSDYATFANLPTCSGAAGIACEPSPIDRPAWPNWATFAPDGTMYVSDLNQATIWKVPAGGGNAEIWYQNSDFASIYGVNGMQFDAAGRLNFVVTVSLVPRVESFGRGVVHRLSMMPDGMPGALETVTVTGQGDGLTIGSSGRIYLPIANPLYNAVEVVDPDTRSVVASLPTPVESITRSIPYSTPASVAFRGTSLIVSNHGLLAIDPHQWAILELGVGETGLPLHYPKGLA